MSNRDASLPTSQPTTALRLFCLALMVPAGAINGAFVALAVPELAHYGIPALLIAGIAGGVLGMLPARWLARKIHEGLSE
jgi:hypothetical protein